VLASTVCVISGQSNPLHVSVEAGWVRNWMKGQGHVIERQGDLVAGNFPGGDAVVAAWPGAVSAWIFGSGTAVRRAVLDDLVLGPNDDG